MNTKTTTQESPRKGKGRYLEPNLPKLGNGRNDRGGTHYTPWLLIRSDANDDGTRPLPGGAVFWESPDVWVVSTAGINQPIPGQPNTVFARVSNLGLEDATGVIVQFWWANPSLAITETNAHLINNQPGTLPSVTVPAQSSVVVQCPVPWIPSVENGGHECLLAQAYIPAFDDLTAPLDPVDDRHVGQKNEQLLLAPQGQQLKIHVDAVNIHAMTQALTFEVQPIRALALPPILAKAALRQTKIALPSKTLPLAMKLLDRSIFVGASAFFARRLLSSTLQSLAGATSYCVVPTQISHTATFAPWELRTMELTCAVPSDARPGESFAFRIVQRAGNLITGGYTVYVVVTGG